MDYRDPADRLPEGLSRRQFLSAGGGRAARVAAALFLPGGGRRSAADEDVEAEGLEGEPEDAQETHL